MIRRRSFSLSCAPQGPLLLAVLLGTLSCATYFSPRTIHDEIVRQTGQDPASVFELTLGRPTMALAKTLLATSSSDGKIPLAGLASFELAVYGVPEGAGELDFTRMVVRGWTPVVKARKSPNSAFVLIQPAGDAIADLVLVAGGSDQVLYARLQGRLAPSLPDALGRAVIEGGPDAVRSALTPLPEEPQ